MLISSRFKGGALLLVLTQLVACGSGGGSSPPPPQPQSNPFTASDGPTMQISTIAGIPSFMMSSIAFSSTSSGSTTTSTISAGPNGTVHNSVFTLGNPAPTGVSLIGSVATQPGTIAVPGANLAMTSTHLGTGVGLSDSDFGLWAIQDAIASQPANAVIAYSAYAGGTLPTSAMPTTGGAVYFGKMTGEVAKSTVGGSDDVSGNAELVVDFANGTLSGTLGGIVTAAGVSTVVPYTGYAAAADIPIHDIALSNGVISGNTFTATASSSSFAGVNNTTVKGHFYGSAAGEITGTFTLADPTPGVARMFIGSFGVKRPAAGTFTALAAPTLHVSTVSIIPTLLMSPIDFFSTSSSGITTSNVVNGPNGSTQNGIFTLSSPPPLGTSIINAVATQPGTINLSGTTLQMTSTSLASTVGLSSTDFGLWTIRDALASPQPANAMTTYSAYAGGTQYPGTMPSTGSVVFNGQMTGELTKTTIGGSDDVSGTISLTVDFAAGTVSGSISSIVTTPGVSTLTAYTAYAAAADIPFNDMVISAGTITGNSFTATVNSPSIAGATNTTLSGKFYGNTANELAGSFVLSQPTPGPAQIFIGSFGAKH